MRVPIFVDNDNCARAIMSNRVQPQMIGNVIENKCSNKVYTAVLEFYVL